MYIIAVKDKDENIKGYLYKTHTNVNKYLIGSHTADAFVTQDEALNFIYYSSDYVKNILSDGDKLVVLALTIERIVKEDDKND